MNNNHSASTTLQQRIVERIQREGAITFADYMRMALYEPGYGYYVTGASRVGWEGDFYTSSDVSDFFAHCMGHQLYQMWGQLGRPTPFTVLEQGARREDLARAIRSWAESEAPDFSNALDYHTVDILFGEDVLQAPPYATNNEQIRPWVILSNELVDAFPVHIVEKRDLRLYEVYVTQQNGRLSEILDEPSSPEVAGYLDSYKIPWTTFPDGWRAEINLDASRWIQRSAQLLFGPQPRHKRRGFLLTIDYGGKARDLYTPYRYRGTLACYFRHQLVDYPLRYPGEQDITAHVNFSALINEGRRQGLRLHAFTTQRRWLEDMGIREELARIRQRDFAIIDTARASDQGQVALFRWYNLQQRVAALTDPAGMGNFKVLIMKR